VKEGGLIYTRDGRRNKEIERRIQGWAQGARALGLVKKWNGKENLVLHELCPSVMTKRELSNTVKP